MSRSCKGEIFSTSVSAKDSCMVLTDDGIIKSLPESWPVEVDRSMDFSMPLSVLNLFLAAKADDEPVADEDHLWPDWSVTFDVSFSTRIGVNVNAEMLVDLSADMALFGGDG